MISLSLSLTASTDQDFHIASIIFNLITCPPNIDQVIKWNYHALTSIGRTSIYDTDYVFSLYSYVYISLYTHPYKARSVVLSYLFPFIMFLKMIGKYCIIFSITISYPFKSYFLINLILFSTLNFFKASDQLCKITRD